MGYVGINFDSRIGLSIANKHIYSITSFWHDKGYVLSYIFDGMILNP